MNLINCFRRLWHARQLAVSAAESPVKTEGTERMLQGLQQLCAIMPQGEAEVWLSDGQINFSLHWNPKVKAQSNASATMPGNAGEKQRNISQENACQTGGLYFLLNGWNNEVQYARYEEENTDAPSQTAEQQGNNGKEPQARSSVLSDEASTENSKNSAPVTEEKREKPSRQLKTLKQLLSYLQLHYAFRYNRLTDRTEYAFIAEEGGKEASHGLHFQPADNRVLNSISLQVMQAGIPCWDRDVKRYIESAEIPSFHPFTAYIEQLPEWDGVDRVSSLARRVSDGKTWVKSFHRWMLASASQWMDFGNKSKRANSVAPLLVSMRQGLGKSTFCRLLLPPELQEYFTESFDLTNPSSAENKLASFGLINLDEFDRLPSTRMPQLKNLMQMERLNIRRAYKHSGEPLPRIANFIGTSNRRDLLTDRSGSRRFICVEVSRPIDCATPIEYDQLYAQLKYELLHGERSWFSKEEEAEIQAANEAFYRMTPAEELLGDTFQLCEPHEEGAHLLSAAQIYTSLKSQHPAALQDCTPLAFSRMLAQVGKRVHTKHGNGYWVKCLRDKNSIYGKKRGDCFVS